MFIVSSGRTVAKRPGGEIPGPVPAALSAPGRVRPSRTPASGNGAAWNERERHCPLTGGGSHRAARWPCRRRPARPGGGIPGRGLAAALSAPGRYVRVRPPGSLLPGSCRSVPCRPNAPCRSSTLAWMHACCGQPRHHAAGLSRGHCHALSSSSNSGQLG